MQDSDANTQVAGLSAEYRDTYYRECAKVTWVGIWVNVVLTVLKVVFGFVSSSRALLADGFESLLDVLSTSLVAVSFKVSSKPSDSNHPYGHYKIETIASAAVGLLLVGTAVAIGLNASFAIARDNNLRPGVAALVVSVVVILVKELLYRYTMVAGKRFSSDLIVANAHHHRSDAYSTGATLLSIGLARWGWAVFDSIGALMVVIVLLWMAGKIFLTVSQAVMDTAPSPEYLQSLQEKLESVNGLREITSLRVRPVGPFYHVEIKLGVDKNMTVEEGHRIGTEAKETILKAFPRVAEVTVHINPR
ncbi:MAG: cation diffusion facilitator family transporter [bacterium]